MLGGWELRLLPGSGHVCCTSETEVDRVLSDTLFNNNNSEARERRIKQECVLVEEEISSDM
jgi:hypothetical protein